MIEKEYKIKSTNKKMDSNGKEYIILNLFDMDQEEKDELLNSSNILISSYTTEMRKN